MSVTDAAPYTPQFEPDGPEASWLPESPPAAILERLVALTDASMEALFDFWAEERRNAARAYLGTLMNWRPGMAHPAGPKVDPSDLGSRLHAMLLDDLRTVAPCLDMPDTICRMRDLKAVENYGEQHVRLELCDCLALGEPWERVAEMAEAVHFCRRRDERAKILREALGKAHSPEAIEQACANLRAVK